MAVLGECAKLIGLVLSVESGVAVLRTLEQGASAAVGRAAREVRVLPLDALCRVDARTVSMSAIG